MWQRRSVMVSILVSLAALGAARAQVAAPPLSPEQKRQGAPRTSPGNAAPTAPDAAEGLRQIAKPPTAAVVVGLDTLEGVIGKAVRSEAGDEDMGQIVDVLVGGNGQARAAVIDFGGFLGVGSRKVAVDWKALNFATSIKSGSVKVSLTRDQIRQSPEYKTGEPVVILEGTNPSPSQASPAAPGTGPAH